MNRNEYRRAFIMLRAAQPGYGGHVRLERRTLTAGMYFMVSAPQSVDALTAMLAGQRDGAYYAASLGELTRDRRGQLTLARSFDPRNIDGRPLEAYAWVVLARAEAPCAVVLTGNVDGSRPMDPAALQRAVEALLAPPEPPPASDLPEPDEPPVPEADPPVPEVPEAPQPPAEDIRIYTRVRQAAPAPKEEAAASEEETPAPQDEAPAPREEAPALQEEAPAPREEAPVEAVAEPPAGEGVGEAAGADERTTAARQLGLDITRAWPGPAEALRRLFATQVPAQTPLGDGFVYVRAPQPGGGQCYLAGLKAAEGRPAALRYAVPGRQSPQPPAGLEAYRYIGEDPEGYWVMDVSL